MTLIHRCRFGRCRVLAVVRIGHTSKQVQACEPCAEVFRSADVPTQRRMLAAARPVDAYHSSAGRLTYPPAGCER